MSDMEKNRIDNELQRIKYELENNKVPNKKDLDFVLEHQEYLEGDKKEEFERMIPKINELMSNKEKKQNSMIVRKENPFMKIPIIKKIYEMMQKKSNKENKERKYNRENNDIKYSSKPKPQVDIKQEVKIKKENKRETIVISDLHGNGVKWEWARQRLIENPNSKLIILGDAMDRQEYGVEILLEIQQLSEYGRVQYLPGNHDMFAYNYINARGKNEAIYEQAKRSLECNGGKITIEKLKDFDKIVLEELKQGRIQRPVSLENFMSWLGSQPIQTIKEENDTKYALAHALFDTELYNYNKSFCLKDALDMQLQGKNDEIIKKFQNVMWYREQDPNTHYAPVAWPKDHVVIVGHTPQKSTNMQNIENDSRKSIIYVDCGRRDLQGFNLNTGRHDIIEPKVESQKQICDRQGERE